MASLEERQQDMRRRWYHPRRRPRTAKPPNEIAIIDLRQDAHEPLLEPYETALGLWKKYESIGYRGSFEEWLRACSYLGETVLDACLNDE